MNWLFPLTISIISFSLVALFQKVFMKEEKNDPLAYSSLTQFMSGVFVLIGGSLFSLLNFPSLDTLLEKNLLPFILLSGIAYALNIFSSFKALKYISASKFIIIYSVRSVFILLLASFALSETLNLQQIIGMLLIIFGIFYVNFQSTKDLFKFEKGEGYAILGAIAFAVGSTSDKFILEWVDPAPYLAIGFFIPATILFLSTPKIIKSFPAMLAKGNLAKLVFYTFVYAVAALSVYYAFILADNISLVSAAGQVSTILIVLLGIVVLKEKEDMNKKILAGIISFVGLVFLVV